MTTRTIQLPLATRQATVTPTSLNAEERTVDVIWTTGAPVKRYDWVKDQVVIEELVVSGAILGRLNANAPVLNSHTEHNLQSVIGVVERAWLDKEKKNGYATLRFSERADVDPIWTDVRTGILKNISVGYSIDQAERIAAKKKGDPDILRVTRFTPLELSVVAVPADAGAQIRSQSTLFSCSLTGGEIMSDENLVEEAGAPPDNIEHIRREYRQAERIGAKKAVVEERKRISELDEMFSLPLVPKDDFFRGIKVRAIDNGWSADATRKYLLDVLCEDAEPAIDYGSVSDDGMGMAHAVGMTPSRVSPAMPYGSETARPVRSMPQPPSYSRQTMGRIEVTRDAAETFAQSVEQAMLIRCGVERDSKVVQDARERGVLNLTWIELGRKLFETSGRAATVNGKDKFQLAEAMLTRAGPMTHTDFPNILANVATKIARKGFSEAVTTYQDWCNIGFLADFKPATVGGSGMFSDLDLIPRGGGPYQYGTLADVGETAQLATYGKLFGISRVAIVNDDLNEFASIGRKMGAAAARKVNALAYAVLTSNQVMTEDTTALFHANHSNLVAQGSGAAPSVTTLNAAEAAMALQQAPKQSTDATVAYLNVTPSHLLVPVSLKATAMTLVESQYDPAGTTASKSTRDAPNIWRNRLIVTADAALGTASATGWYLAAQKGNANVETVTVFFLDGSNGEPYIEEQQQFSTDGVTYKVRIDAVARALDFRGLYSNYGA